ncbi:hypothetical protein ACTXT7_000484 [Hymenolepis weldensis]
MVLYYYKPWRKITTIFNHEKASKLEKKYNSQARDESVEVEVVMRMHTPSSTNDTFKAKKNKMSNARFDRKNVWSSLN